MITIGKIKQGTRNRNFLWGHNDFDKADVPSTSLVIISKDFDKRAKLIQNVSTTDNFKVIHLTGLDIISLGTELQKYKGMVKERLKNPDKIMSNFLLCLDDYDLLLYEENVTSVSLVKNCINYINDYGKRIGIFLLLGCNSLNERFIENIDNILLLPPYNLSYLHFIFKNSIFEVLSSLDDPIGQFCRMNSITIDQLKKEPAVLKNINNVYLFKE